MLPLKLCISSEKPIGDCKIHRVVFSAIHSDTMTEKRVNENFSLIGLIEKYRQLIFKK
jgi:hypothetical protein